MPTLIDRHVAFVAALRDAGLQVSVAESLDAVHALETVDLLEREQVRAAFAATLVKRELHRPTFDAIFDLFFPPLLGHRGAGTHDDDERVPEPRANPLDDPRRDRLREQLADYLRDGETAGRHGIDDVVRAAVDAFGGIPGRDGAPSWSSLATLNKMSARTLMAGLLQQVLAGAPRGGLAEKRARSMIDDRIGEFERRVSSEVARRLAERSDPGEVARTATRPSIDKVAFLGATRAELAALRREIQPLARRLAARLAMDQRRGSRGELDFRATVRNSMSTGGVPMVTRHRPRRPKKTDLVVLCDLSESVSSFAHFTLLLVYALREQFTRVRAFGFVDELDELTRFFVPGADVVDTVTRLSAEADVTWLFGRTDYGRAFELFEQRFPDAVGPRTALLVLGDARSNYGKLALPAVTSLVDRARHAYWLNPERRGIWDTGDSRASDYGALLPMTECRNLTQLGEFVRDLSRD